MTDYVSLAVSVRGDRAAQHLQIRRDLSKMDSDDRQSHR